MNTYLTIMVTVLVATQVIRITQNAISLHRQRKSIERNVAWFKDNEVTEEDFKTQKEVMRMLKSVLSKKIEDNYRDDHCKYCVYSDLSWEDEPCDNCTSDNSFFKVNEGEWTNDD